MKVFRSMIIDAEIAKVWSGVRAFDGVSRWNPGVTAARMENGHATQVGAIRHLDIADGSVFRETLLAHSDIEHFYTYDIIESPLPVSNYVSTHRFVAITHTSQTLGIWESTFTCVDTDADELAVIVGDQIYISGMQGLNDFLNNSGA